MYGHVWSSLPLARQLRRGKKSKVFLFVSLHARDLIDCTFTFGNQIDEFRSIHARAHLCHHGQYISIICNLFTRFPLLPCSYQHNHLGMPKLEQSFLFKIMASKIWIPFQRWDYKEFTFILLLRLKRWQLLCLALTQEKAWYCLIIIIVKKSKQWLVNSVNK